MIKISLIAALFAFSTSAMAGVSVIQNTADSFAMKDVKSAWSGNNKNITIVNNEASSKEFFSDVLDENEKRTMRKLKSRFFSGHISEPVNLKTDEEVLEYVSGNPGSIGYVDSSSVSDKVKVID